jgi:chromosome segregation ATPase
VKMTKEILRSLGSCSDYLTKFRNQFPVRTYPNGVEVTRELCENHHQRFDWSWGAEVMLTYDANREYIKRTQSGDRVVDELSARQVEAKKLYDEQTAAWRTKYNQPYAWPESDASAEARRTNTEINATFNRANEEIDLDRSKHRAGTFGELMQDPSNYSSRLTQALVEEETRQEARDRQAVAAAELDVKANVDMIENLRRAINDANENIKRWTDEIPQLEAKGPELERNLAELRIKFTNRDLERARERAEAAQRVVDDLQRKLNEAVETRAKTAPTESQETSESTPVEA